MHDADHNSPDTRHTVTTAMRADHVLNGTPMDLTQEGKHVAPVEDLKWIPARQGFHYEPHFCGRMNVVLDEPSPTQLTFRCDDDLVVGQEYSLSEGQDKVFRVRITRASDNLNTATVVDVGQSHDNEASGERG